MRPDIAPQPPRPSLPLARRSMGDVMPRSRPSQPAVLPPAVATVPQAKVPEQSTLPSPEPPSLPSVELDPQPSEKKPKKSRKRLIITIILAAAVVLIITIVSGAYFWYQAQLGPVTNSQSASRVRVTIETGSTPDQIGKLLYQKKLIRSDLAFSIYTRQRGVQGQLEAGTFSLKPSDSLASIVSHLVLGKTDEFNLTFLPGNTLAKDREAIISAGYSPAEVDAALAKVYDHPALATKPATADLEGYIYGETYALNGDTTVEEIVTRALDQLEKQIVAYNLVDGYKQQGLTLYQGITLASIIEREVANPADARQVAQVFLKRLKEGTPLGSDVTFMYAAKKLGVPAVPTLDSPYNTRIYKGLPPGPISNPGLAALQAVANPAPGDYNFFLAGDDGKMYYAYTYDEHQANITQHCQKGCQ